jgi:hypothetical protein
MSDWVVIVHEYVPKNFPRWLEENQPPPYNTHFTPIAISQYVPLHLTLFVAQTNESEVPVFSATRADHALKTYERALPPRFEHPWLPLSNGPHFIKPYTWLCDQFGVHALRPPQHYATLFVTHYL